MDTVIMSQANKKNSDIDSSISVLNKFERERLALEADIEVTVPPSHSTKHILRPYVNAKKYKSEDNKDLFFKFKNMVGLKTCLPDHLQQTTHFSDLPFELVLYILRFVSSDDIVDVKTLDQCAAVCRGWYLCARDPIIYYQACSKIWMENVKHLPKYGGNWRRMLLERLDLYTSGCYIYFDSMIQFFYYLRFFSDGRFLYLKSKESPKEMLPLFKKIEETPLKNTVVTGRYTFSGGTIRINFDTSLIDTYDIDFDNHIMLRVIDTLNFEVMEYKCKRYGMLHCSKRDQRYQNRLHLSKYIFHSF